MKKIIINGRFLIHRITGVERYAREILIELDRIIEPGEFELAIPTDVKYVPSFKNIKVKRVGKFKNRLWEHVSFPFYVLRQEGVSLNLCNVAPLLSPGIVCIHDVKIKAKPEYYSKKFLAWYRLLFFNAIKRSKYIITVSEFSKDEICKYYKVNRSKITVIPNAWQHFERVTYDENTLSKYHLEKNEFFFSMCSLEPNKNFKWIAEEAILNSEQIFAVAGSINNEVFSNSMPLKCPDNMILLGYISDEEAKTLMRDCKAFLFPTIYEGFGIPPLEALSAGAQKIYVSDTDVMHEIFKDYVYYIDPEKYNYKLEREDKGLYTEESNPLDNFSWKRSAQKLYNLLNNVRRKKEK